MTESVTVLPVSRLSNALDSFCPTCGRYSAREPGPAATVREPSRSPLLVGFCRCRGKFFHAR